MLTLILIFAGSLILAVDPLTRHTIVLSGAQRSELQKCLNRFLEQRLQDEIEGLLHCAEQCLYAIFGLLLLIGSLIALIGQALIPDAKNRQLQYHAKISVL